MASVNQQFHLLIKWLSQYADIDFDKDNDHLERSAATSYQSWNQSTIIKFNWVICNIKTSEDINNDMHDIFINASLIFWFLITCVHICYH